MQEYSDVVLLQRRDKSRSKYPWKDLDERGWFFVPLDKSIHQPPAIRSCARWHGYKVSVRICELHGRPGYVVLRNA